jgi:hypothetical protein
MKWLGIILMAILLAAAPGYSQAQTPAKATPAPAAQPQGAEMKAAPATAAKSSTPEARKEYEKKAAQDLDVLQQQIHDLSVKAQTAAPQVKSSMIRAMVSLDRQEIAARKKLGNLKKASQKDWDALKTEMDKVLDNLKKSYASVEVHLH